VDADSDEFRDLVEQVRRMSDRQAIIDCIYRYARGLDRHDDEVLSSAFHPDAIDNHGSWVSGVDEFVAWANHECHDPYRAHSHNITTNSVEITGDTAHAESYLIFVLHRKDGNSVLVGGGRYIDRLDKRDGEWKISLRRLVMDWRFEADATIWHQDTRPYPRGTWDRDDASYQRPLTLPDELAARVRAGDTGFGG
jgi:hypothetical protein